MRVVSVDTVLRWPAGVVASDIAPVTTAMRSRPRARFRRQDVPAFVAAAVFAVFAIAGSPSCAIAGPKPGTEVSFDIFAFSQDDELGQPLKAEGLSYAGTRVSLALPLNPTTLMRVNLSATRIKHDPAQRVPATIGNVNVTSASADLVALDFAASWEMRNDERTWTTIPGIFYHHQDGYIAGGVDMAVRRSLHGGDAVVSGSIAIRASLPRLEYWDSSKRGRSHRGTVTSEFGITQTLSPSLVVGFNVQATAQAGLLSETFNYVVLETAAGVPFLIIDETLPRRRNRGQLNVRARYSPAVGVALGLDLSGYRDSWGIRHAAWEPLIVLPIGETTRFRAWYRRVDQGAADHFVTAPTRETFYRTQDSDLGDFTSNSGGLSVEFPVGFERGVRSAVRMTAFGFDRSDGLSALGAGIGMDVTW